MAVKIYDASAGAFKDAPTPQIYDASSQAYKDSTGLVYDTSKGAWDERWGSVKIVPFATGTDEEIAAMVAAHYADKIRLSDYWAVGDTRTVSLYAMAATGVDESHRAQDVQFVIGDFDHDELATSINDHSKAAVTLLQKDCLMDASSASNPGHGNTENGYMNSDNTNAGGWKSCARRTWCNNVYFSALPSVWQSIVKTVNKKTSAGRQQSTIETVQDKIFLASEIEIFSGATYSYGGEGARYQFYKNGTSNLIKRPVFSSDHFSSSYFMRSPCKFNNRQFCMANVMLNISSLEATDFAGIAPCLCI